MENISHCCEKDYNINYICKRLNKLYCGDCILKEKIDDYQTIDNLEKDLIESFKYIKNNEIKNKNNSINRILEDIYEKLIKESNNYVKLAYNEKQIIDCFKYLHDVFIYKQQEYMKSINNLKQQSETTCIEIIKELKSINNIINFTNNSSLINNDKLESEESGNIEETMFDSHQSQIFYSEIIQSVPNCLNYKEFINQNTFLDRYDFQYNNILSSSNNSKLQILKQLYLHNNKYPTNINKSPLNIPKVLFTPKVDYFSDNCHLYYDIRSENSTIPDTFISTTPDKLNSTIKDDDISTSPISKSIRKHISKDIFNDFDSMEENISENSNMDLEKIIIQHNTPTSTKEEFSIPTPIMKLRKTKSISKSIDELILPKYLYSIDSKSKISLINISEPNFQHINFKDNQYIETVELPESDMKMLNSMVNVGCKVYMFGQPQRNTYTIFSIDKKNDKKRYKEILLDGVDFGTEVSACYDKNQNCIYLLSGLDKNNRFLDRIARFNCNTKEFDHNYFKFNCKYNIILSFIYNGNLYFLPYKDSNFIVFDIEKKSIKEKFKFENNDFKSLVACTDGKGTVFIYSESGKFIKLHIDSPKDVKSLSTTLPYCWFYMYSSYVDVSSSLVYISYHNKNDCFIFSLGGKSKGNYYYSINTNTWAKCFIDDPHYRDYCGSVNIN